MFDTHLMYRKRYNMEFGQSLANILLFNEDGRYDADTDT